MDAVPWRSRKWVAIGVDLLVVFCIYFGVLSLRFDGSIPDVYVSRFLAFMPFVLATNAIVGLHIHAHRSDAPRLQVGAAALASGSMTVAVGFLLGHPVPNSVLIVGALGSAVALLGARALGRSAH